MWGGKNLMINHVQLFILLFWSCIVTSSLKELRVNFSRPNNTLTLLLFVFLILIILCPLYFVLIFYCSNFFLRKKKICDQQKTRTAKGFEIQNMFLPNYRLFQKVEKKQKRNYNHPAAGRSNQITYHQKWYLKWYIPFLCTCLLVPFPHSYSHIS